MDKSNLHFLVYIPESGKYSIIGEFSAGYASSLLTVKVSGQEKAIDIPKTDGWFNTEIVDAGEFDFNSPGVYHLVLQPAEALKWKAVNVWELHLSAVE